MLPRRRGWRRGYPSINSNGVVVAGPVLRSLDPLESGNLTSTHDAASHCIVRVEIGRDKDARVALYIRDASGAIEAAVTASK